MTTIAVTNLSTLYTDAEIRHYTAAVNKQLNNDFHPHWGTHGSCYFYPKDRPIPADYWRVAVVDDAKEPGAVGFHDVTNTNAPIGFIDAGVCKQYGLALSVTLSHELLEMMGDPECVRAAQISDTSFTAWEMCDAVEADQLGYEIGDVLVSDFVLPNYFTPNAPGPWDFGGHLHKPLDLAPGGYAAVWSVHLVNGKLQAGWGQITAEAIPGVTSRSAFATRIEKRKH